MVGPEQNQKHGRDEQMRQFSHGNFPFTRAVVYALGQAH
jgi:hypothetical protein